jgi:pyruvate/oxaloacetate carboxyltransferase
MKILRKQNEFKKMPHKSIEDVLTINALTRQGWKYCSRKEYKDYYNQNTIKEETTIKPKKEKN